MLCNLSSRLSDAAGILVEEVVEVVEEEEEEEEEEETFLDCSKPDNVFIRVAIID